MGAIGEEEHGFLLESGHSRSSSLEPVKRRLQSSRRWSMGKGIVEGGNQGWGVASSGQSSPICARCQRRTGARMRLGGTGWARWFSMAQRRTWVRSSLQAWRRQGFGSGEAPGTRRRAGQSFFQEVHDRLRPGGGMIATGSAGRPEGRLFFRAHAVL